MAAPGRSGGTCTNARRVLTELGPLGAGAARGRGSGRRVADRGKLLDGYAAEAGAIANPRAVTVGVTWCAPVSGVAELGHRLTGQQLDWAATGSARATPHRGRAPDAGRVSDDQHA